jgi:PKD repeat protein
VTLDAKKQVPITITFDFAYDSITKGNVNVFNNESYVNTQLLGSAPSFDSKTNTVNFVVTRLKETDPGEVTLWCEVTGKDSDGVSYYKIEKIIIYIQPMSGGHIPYTVSGNTVMDASNNVNVVVTFDFTGFSSCNLNLNTVYTDTSTNTNPSFTDNKNPLVLTASANKVSFTVKKTADPADVTFWVEVTGIDSAMDSNPNNKATDKHLYYDMFEQIVVPILPTPPIADFSSNVTVGNSPLTVQFNGISTGGTATSWVWDFGDSSGTSTEKNPIHTFPANNGQFAVTYSVTLTATNIVGSDTETKVSYITVKPPAPVASFEGTPTSGNKPLAVQFTDKSSGPYLTYIWNFGDGTAVNNLKNPQHTCNNKGTYAVTLTVTNAGGTSTSTITKYIDVKN